MSTQLATINPEELHTIGLKKKDVGLVAAALAFFYANRNVAKIQPEEAEQTKDLFDFFKSVYNSKGAS